LRGAPSLTRLPTNYHACNKPDKNKGPIGIHEGCLPMWRVGAGFSLIVITVVVSFRRRGGWGRLVLFFAHLFFVGGLDCLTGQRNTPTNAAIANIATTFSIIHKPYHRNLSTEE
jgi:hypothetical protein